MYLPSKTEDLVPETRTVDETGKILLKAADLIRENGHSKYVLMDERGALCLHGAIAFAYQQDLNLRSALGVGNGRHFPKDPAQQRMGEYLMSRGNIEPWETHGCRWNNHPDRTADEVIAALTDAAYMVEA